MTAVEWLTEEMIQRKFFEKETELSYTTLELLTNEANEMFKQQIIDTYIHIKKEYICGMDCYPPQFVVDEAKQYYNQRFKNE